MGSVLLSNKIIGTIAYMGGVWALPESFTWSWGQLIQFNTEYLCQPGEIVHYDRATVSYHSFARNMLVTRMRGDWLLMLDTDHTFTPDLAVRLLHRMQLYNLDVVTGIYQFKGPPHSPVLYTWENDGFSPLGAWDNAIPIFQVAAAGAGVLLVHRRVFNRIQDELGELPFDIHPPYSEDLSFFYRLRKLGIPAYCDTRIHLPHLMPHGVTMDDYDMTAVSLAPRQEVEGFV